jgi:hypothetical protein
VVEFGFNLWFNELNAAPREQMMKTVLAYTALLLLGFVLAMLYGVVLVEEIQRVVPAVSNRLNAD